MKKTNKYIYLGVVGLLSLCSCNDFLDKMPDNRIDPSTPKQLQLMLVDGYSDADYASMCEISSDNVVDNHTPDEMGQSYPNLQSYTPILDQYYAWEDANLDNQQDSPTYVWSGYYHAIAVANHVLDKIDEVRANYPSDEDQAKLDAVYGEALLIRAYHHFLLVNLFSMQYGVNSSTDMGIPYCTEPETQVKVDYDRGNVAQVYENIEKDLVEGLKYVNEGYYTQLRFHFNLAAANAFAARFYLYKRDYDKVEEYASKALGADPSSKTRIDYWKQNYTSLGADASTFYSSSSANNFLLVPKMGMIFYYVCNGGARYANNREASVATLYGSGPVWEKYLPVMLSRLYVNGKQAYGLWPSWMYMFFEYTDKVAGIGFPHRMCAEFTGEDALLMRAEARIFKGNLPGAVEDLNTWVQSHDTSNNIDELTANIITSYYRQRTVQSDSRDPIPYVTPDLHIDEVCNPVNPAYTVTDEKLPYLWCMLHFRRIETVFSGMRWFDIKRYGLEITHRIGRTESRTLSTFDLRRAFQVPTESLEAGLEPTPRAAAPTSESSQVRFVVD